MEIPAFSLTRQYKNLEPELNQAIKSVFEKGNFILGENVEKFEKEFASYCNKKFAIGVGSGTEALHLALRAYGIKEGDEVITPPNSFIATALTISQVGAKPIFADIEKDTYNIDAAKIEKAITKKTKAIMPVHLYGQPADMDVINEVAEKHSLAIIEDACQSHGAEYKGKKVPVTNIGCFSFYPVKNLGCYGDGGMIVTNDKEVAEKLFLLRNYGQTKKYYHKILGFNSRLDEIQAAILRVKLKHLDKWTEQRREKAQLYNSLLKDSNVITPIEKSYAKHVYHLYVIRSKQRNKLQEHLKKEGIGTIIHYPIPIPLQEAYAHLKIKKGTYSITEDYASQILSLPLYPELTKEEIEFVAEKICKFKEKKW